MNVFFSGGGIYLYIYFYFVYSRVTINAVRLMACGERSTRGIKTAAQIIVAHFMLHTYRERRGFIDVERESHAG